MSNRLYYKSASGKIVEMSGPKIYAGTALDLRVGSWDIELNSHSVRSAVRSLRTPSLDVAFRSHAEADRATAVFDEDIAMNSPGTIFATGWQQRAFITSMTGSNLGHDFLRASLGVALLDGVWRKPETFSLFPMSGDIDGTKRYGYEYDYVYAGDFGVRYIDVPDASPIPWEMRIWGFALSPSLTIAGNAYHFDLQVPGGNYLHVDSRPDPTVELVLQDGSKIDKFDSATVGTGQGCGNYAFEPIPPGRHSVRWNDLFGVDLTLWHERGCPPYDH